MTVRLWRPHFKKEEKPKQNHPFRHWTSVCHDEMDCPGQPDPANQNADIDDPSDLIGQENLHPNNMIGQETNSVDTRLYPQNRISLQSIPIPNPNQRNESRNRDLRSFFVRRT